MICLFHFISQTLSFTLYVFILFILFTAMIIKFDSEQFYLQEYANIKDVSVEIVTAHDSAVIGGRCHKVLLHLIMIEL